MGNYDLTITRILNVHHTTTESWAMPRMVRREKSGVVYFEAGSITYHFDEGDATAGPGDALIFPRGLHYCGEKATAVNQFYVIDFETDPPDALEALGLPRVMRAGEAAGRLFRQCETDSRGGGLPSALRRRGDLYALLAELTAQNARGSRRSALLEEILSYVQGRYTDPGLSVDGLSRAFHISASQLRRLFQETLGVSPLRYITELRLALAKNLLRHECLPVGETAARCGFSSEFYFSRLFHQRMGMPPSAFR